MVGISYEDIKRVAQKRPTYLQFPNSISAIEHRQNLMIEFVVVVFVKMGVVEGDDAEKWSVHK